ncbi:MAG: hypothetical protein JWQ60_5757, partial [Pseudonocardia sp.]|nr:hypothetical protein [Pseudonocardia sp.]
GVLRTLPCRPGLASGICAKGQSAGHRIDRASGRADNATAPDFTSAVRRGVADG